MVHTEVYNWKTDRILFGFHSSPLCCALRDNLKLRDEDLLTEEAIKFTNHRLGLDVNRHPL